VHVQWIRVVGVLAVSLVACGGGGGGGGGPGSGEGTCTTRKPLAVLDWASPVSPAPARQPIPLNGGYSYSYQGAPLAYAWSLVSRPAGSGAAIVGAGAHPSFTPDLVGSYAVSLVVSDPCGASAPQVATITAGEYGPMARVSPSYAVTTAPAGQVAVDGSPSYDLNGDPLKFAWTFSPPPGSAATLVDPAAPVARFTPDVEGDYQLQLVVSDGTGRISYAASSDVDVRYPARGVPYSAWDAAYSAPLDRVVIVTSEPALRIVNPHDGTSTAVALDAQPYAVSVSPDGTQAAVAQLTHFSLVRLADPAGVVTTYAPVSTQWTYDGGDVVLDGRGYAYAFPATNISADPLVVNLATRAVTDGGANAVAEQDTAVKPALDLVRNRMYVLGPYTDGVIEYTTPAGSLTYSRRSLSYLQQFGGPWLAPDGTRIYGGSGDVWSPTTLTTSASLHVVAGDTASFDCVEDSTVAGKILASTGGYGVDAFRVYDRSLSAPPVKKYAPAVFSGKSATTGNVRWVFWKRDGSGYYAVLVGSGLTGIAEY
jgi:hypothetical protein